jgi:hypothetical protein
MYLIQILKDGDFYIAISTISGEEIARKRTSTSLDREVEGWLRNELPKIFKVVASDGCNHVLGIVLSENDAACGGGCGYKATSTKDDAAVVYADNSLDRAMPYPNQPRNALVFNFCPVCGQKLR